MTEHTTASATLICAFETKDESVHLQRWEHWSSNAPQWWSTFVDTWWTGIPQGINTHRSDPEQSCALVQRNLLVLNLLSSFHCQPHW